MAKGPEQQRLTPEERTNLVAYLDGELTDAEAHTISAKLTRSPTARHELDSLRKTWEMLDFLPRPAASEQFSERTVSEIRRLDLQTAPWQTAARRWSGLVGRIAASLLIAALSLVVGFVVTRWIVPDPTARLARELSLAEHLDEYRDVGTFEFLSQLADSLEFGAEPR